jgi:hypothetical protein
MTVISMISFGESGAAVADEQSSTMLRKHNIASKLRIIDNSMIYGGSGAAFFIKEAYDATLETIENLKRDKATITPEKIYSIAKAAMTDLKNSHKNKFLLDMFGLKLSELQTGKKENGAGLDDSFKARAYEGHNEYSRELRIAVLLGGLCNEKFEIFYLDTAGNDAGKVPNHYETIGSGSDEAEKVLSRYFAEMSRDLREKSPVDVGLVKLIEATNSAAKINQGVGGNPSIVYMAKDSIIEPNESQCILASEIV